jgi:hypothetical protein
MPSHVMVHPELAKTFEAVATEGHKGFYEGRIAQGTCLSNPLNTLTQASQRSWI